VCRVICETKKVPKVTYSCECEDFCVPGPSERTRVCDCDNCKKWVYTPTCGTVRTRKKLVKHEEMKEVVSYRWVVENMCPACATKTSDPNIAPEPEDAAARRSPNAALPVSYQTSGHEAIPFQPIPYPAIPNPPVSPTR
jgi:hypothetical protein